MMELAGREHDVAQYDTLATLLAVTRRIPRPFGARALVDLASGDDGRRATLLRDAASLTAVDPMPAWVVATFAEDLAAARAFGTLWSARATTPRERAQLGYLLAGVETAAGRWSAARPAFASAASTAAEAGEAGLHRMVRQAFALCTAVPVLLVGPDEVERMRQEVLSWTLPAAAGNASLEPIARLEPLMRAYLLALLDIRLGGAETARATAATIERLPVPDGAERIAALLGRSVRAAAALHAGQPAAALAAIGARDEPVPPLFASEYRIAEVHARWLRAEALFQLRRDAEALRWYALALEAPVVNGALLELALRAPSHLRRGEIHERAGNAALAREHYGRFRALWAAADPPGIALVREVAAREARLGGGAGRGSRPPQ